MPFAAIVVKSALPFGQAFCWTNKDHMRPICRHKFWGTSLRLIAPVVLVAGCTSFPTVAYQPYEGNANFFGSAGGTKLVVGGVDFWINGTPPNPFSVLGVATSEIGSSDSDDIGRTVVTGKVAPVGGSAAIQLTGNSSFSGVLRTTPAVPVPAGRRQMKFAIVKYGPEN